MTSFAPLPHRFHWTPQQLADAVPLRLSELFAFDAAGNAGLPSPANAARTRRRTAGGYLPAAPRPALFRCF